MKVFFATPPLTAERRFGSHAGSASAAPSLGILMLAAATRQTGFNCCVVDACALKLAEEELIQRVVAYDPDVVCLSSTTLGIGSAQLFAEHLRRALPKVTVVVGGPHVTALPLETMQRFPAFDIAVIGEGEATLVEALRALASGTSLSEVPGLIFRKGEFFCDTGRRPFLSDLDALPFPAWDLLENFPDAYPPAPFQARKPTAAALASARGCPNACIFCDRSVFGSSCRTFSADYLVRQIVDLHDRHGIREFSFEDDTFALSGSRLVEICAKLAERELDISWSCVARVDLVTPELLCRMREAGCWQVSFGIESGSPDVLRLCNKGITLEQVRDAVAACREAGLKSKGFFILGHPGETAQTLRMTMDLALELPLDDLSACFMTPFPGTELHARAGEFGRLEADWEHMDLLTPVFIPHGLTREDLLAARKELMRRFYLRPRVVLDYAWRLLENPHVAGGFWSGFRSFLRSI